MIFQLRKICQTAINRIKKWLSETSILMFECAWEKIQEIYNFPNKNKKVQILTENISINKLILYYLVNKQNVLKLIVKWLSFRKLRNEIIKEEWSYSQTQN
jgi:hypothetical protein